MKWLVYVCCLLVFISCGSEREARPMENSYEMLKMAYQNPDLVVDLDVGFKSVPMPMDFDGDGDMDLLVSEAGSYVESGVYYFENIGKSLSSPLFRYAGRVSSDRFRLGHDGKFFAVSEVAGRTHVITPDASKTELIIYKDVPQNVFWDRQRMPKYLNEYVIDTQKNSWLQVDLDSDGRHDLVCAQTKNGKPRLLWFKNEGESVEASYSQPLTLIDDVSFEIPGYHIDIALGDFDADGDYDYVTATPFGQLAYFEGDVLENGVPQFKAQKLITIQETPLQFYSFYGGAIKLRTVDFDQDGHLDILAGDEEGKVTWVRNTGNLKQGMPQFEAPLFLQQQARYLDLGALAAPRVFDWDDDGLDDIISGNGAGDVLFVKNLGGVPPKWDRPISLTTNEGPIRLVAETALPGTEDPHWGYTTLDVGDWDNDGLPDVLVNEHNGNIVFIKNKGEKGNAKLAAPEPLLVDWEGQPQKPAWIPGVSEGNELLAPWRTSPLIMDYNQDGLQDLVMLDYEGYLACFLRKRVDGKLVLSHPKRSFVFPDGSPIQLNQRTGKSHGRLKIEWADWDGDGLEDLVFSSKPAVDWMRNMGKQGDKTVLQYMGRIVSRTLMGHTDGPEVTDFDCNGVPELLVGTETGVLYYWNRRNWQTTTTMTTDGPQQPATYTYFKR
ncbi:FG-GAP repeat domain-containing protein [Sediminicola luteus]|nr:VCBS repeat-containing protein [Sediminicola luteus]